MQHIPTEKGNKWVKSQRDGEKKRNMQLKENKVRFGYRFNMAGREAERFLGVKTHLFARIIHQHQWGLNFHVHSLDWVR